MTYTTYSHTKTFRNHLGPKTAVFSIIVAVLAIGLMLSLSGGSSQASKGPEKNVAPSLPETSRPGTQIEEELHIALCSLTSVQFSGTTAINCSHTEADIHYEYFDAPDIALEAVSQYSLTPYKFASTFLRYGTSDGYHRLMIVNTASLTLINIQSETFTSEDLLHWYETAIEDDSIN